MNANRARYLLIGGYAVNFHGYNRSTGDMDIWIARDEETAQGVARALREFGFSASRPEFFAQPDQIIRIGVPPLRLEILTSISGVAFEDCYERRILANLGDLDVPVISLQDLKCNKRASGRMKDLADLEELG